MRALMRAEIRKVTTTRATYGIALAGVLVVALGVMQTLSTPGEAGLPLWERQLYLLAVINSSLFLLILGIKSATDEFRHGTIVPSLLVAPHRERVVVAKVAVHAVVGLVVAAGMAAVMTALSVSHLDGLDGATLRSLAGFVLAGGLWTALGAAVGMVVRHQVAAIVGAIAWVMILEQLLLARFDGLADWLPVGAAGSLAEAITTPSMVVGGLILFLYAATGGIVAALTMRRRDVI